jgi:hypothetical protein
VAELADFASGSADWPAAARLAGTAGFPSTLTGTSSVLELVTSPIATSAVAMATVLAAQVQEAGITITLRHWAGDKQRRAAATGRAIPAAGWRPGSLTRLAGRCWRDRGS